VGVGGCWGWEGVGGGGCGFCGGVFFGGLVLVLGCLWGVVDWFVWCVLGYLVWLGRACGVWVCWGFFWGGLCGGWVWGGFVGVLGGGFFVFFGEVRGFGCVVEMCFVGGRGGFLWGRGWVFWGGGFGGVAQVSSSLSSFAGSPGPPLPSSSFPSARKEGLRERRPRLSPKVKRGISSKERGEPVAIVSKCSPRGGTALSPLGTGPKRDRPPPDGKDIPRGPQPLMESRK